MARPSQQQKAKHKGSFGRGLSKTPSSAKSTPKSLPAKTAEAIDLLHNATTSALNGNGTQHLMDELEKDDQPPTPTTRVSAADSSTVGVNGGEQPSTSGEQPTPSVPIQPVVAPTKTQAGVKRKADTTTEEEGGAEPPAKLSAAARRESGRPVKRPTKDTAAAFDFASLPHRFKGRLTEQLKFCQRVIIEMFSKRHKPFAWPFYEPVDVEGLKLADYYEKIKQPMDFGTIKKKLDARQYMSAQEFADDMRLVFGNCVKYNPKGDAIHECGVKMRRVFDERWAQLPDEVSPAPSTASEATQGGQPTPRQKALLQSQQSLDAAEHSMDVDQPPPTLTAAGPQTPTQSTQDEEMVIDRVRQQLRQSYDAYMEKAKDIDATLKAVEKLKDARREARVTNAPMPTMPRRCPT